MKSFLNIASDVEKSLSQKESIVISVKFVLKKDTRRDIKNEFKNKI